MKVKIILILCLFVSFISEAQNFFMEGMKWEMQTIGVAPEGPIYGTETVILKNDEKTDSLCMYRYFDNDLSNISFVGYIKTEGEKVFFKLNKEMPSEWYLFYDFGLAPGEGCWIYNPVAAHSTPDPAKTYAKCVGIEKDPIDERLDALRIKLYSNDSEIDSYDEGLWIKGIGSESGVLDNDRFNPCGGTSILSNVYDNSKLLYHNPLASIKEVDHISFINIDGLNVTLNSSEKDSVAIFNISGECIGQYDISGENTTISLPQPGVYILKLRDKTYKICVAN